MARFVLMATSGLIAALTFGFSFGNVWALDLLLGIEAHIAPLVGPAVDLSVIGLLITVQWLSLAGVSVRDLRPARRLLAACGLITMALNSAPSLVRGITTGDPYAYGRAAVEAIAPWLLIAWSHVGPQMLRLFSDVKAAHVTRVAAAEAAEKAAKVAARTPRPAVPEPVQSAPERKTRTHRTSRPDRRLHAVQADRMSQEDRVAELDRHYPDRIPGRNEAMRDLDWTSASETGKAVQALRARREQSTPPTQAGDKSDDDKERVAV